MNKRTKENILRAATAVSIVCAAALVFLPVAASAASAVATSTVNVRSGPGTSYSVIGSLSRGELVDVGGCRSGWCYLTDEEGFVLAGSAALRGSTQLQLRTIQTRTLFIRAYLGSPPPHFNPKPHALRVSPGARRPLPLDCPRLTA